MTSIALSSYLNGICGAGLLFRRPQRSDPWSPLPIEEDQRERAHRVATAALIGGGFVNLLGIGAYCLLVVHGHPWIAGWVINFIALQIVASFFVSRRKTG
jgi:hypothetical protein